MSLVDARDLPTSLVPSPHLLDAIDISSFATEIEVLIDDDICSRCADIVIDGLADLEGSLNFRGRGSVNGRGLNRQIQVLIQIHAESGGSRADGTRSIGGVEPG